MANLWDNIKNLGLPKGPIETVKDALGKGDYQNPAQFFVTDDNGERQEIQNSSAGPIYKTPNGGYSNTRSYAYLTSGDNGKLTLNVSKDLYESNKFKDNFLDNSTFKEVLKTYNANKNADTVIPVTKEDGTTSNMKFSELVQNYNDSLSKFASAYESYSVIRDNVKSYTGFDLTDGEIEIASNRIDKDEKSSNTKVIFLPDEWLHIYDFASMPSYDAETKTVSAKDFFDAYNLDKDGGINEEKWNEMVGSSNGVVANAYSGNMKHNVDEDAGGNEEAVNAAKERLVRSMQASNLLEDYDPEQSFLHTVGIVASNTLVTLDNDIAQLVNKFAMTEGMILEGYLYMHDIGVAAIKDATIYNPAFTGAAVEDINNGYVTPSNYREYIDGILVSSTDGSMSEIEKVRAEWEAKIKGKRGAIHLLNAEGNPLYELNEAAEWHKNYTAQIAPQAAKVGNVMGELIFMALEVALANAAGKAVETALVVKESTFASSLATAFKTGVPTLTRMKSLANALLRNKLAGKGLNIVAQALIDTMAFEDNETFVKAFAELDPESRTALMGAFVENSVMNGVAEAVGIGGEAIGGKIATSDRASAKWIRARSAKAAAIVSLPKKYVQKKFAETKIAKMFNGFGKKSRDATDMAIRVLNQSPDLVYRITDLEGYNIGKFEFEYQATKNIAKAKKGIEYLTDFEKKEKKIAETTTEAILGRVSEKTNFLNQAARISEGIKTFANEIISDSSIASGFRGVEAEVNNVQKVMKWSEFNPAGGRYLSQDASNYIANKTHYDDLLRKQRIKEAAGEALSAGEAKKLETLSTWLRDFASRNSDPAVKALDALIKKEQELNKALTDWQVRHGVFNESSYKSLSGTGFFGDNDELYVRTIALDEGRSMDDLANKEDFEKLYSKAEKKHAETSGYYSGVRDVQTVWDQDMHLGNDVASNYLDPVLTNMMTVSNIAKMYQGKMWYNSLTAIKAPIREIDTAGKPITRKDIKTVISKAENAAAETMRKIAADDLSNLVGGTLGQSYRDSRLVNPKTGNKIVDEREQAVRKKLGVGSDKQVITNTNTLTTDQAKNVIATFGTEAPEYGKVKSSKELEYLFASLSERQQEQALKAMGKNSVETTKTTNVREKNPEYVAWSKEKKAFDSEQSKARKAFNSEQNKARKAFESEQAKAKKKFDSEQAKAKKKYEKDLANANKPKVDTEKVNAQLEKDVRDAIIYSENEDPVSGKELSFEEVDKRLSAERKKEVADILRDDFDLRDYYDGGQKVKNALTEEYIEKVRSNFTYTPDASAIEPFEEKTFEEKAFEEKTFEEKTFDKPAPEEFINSKKTVTTKSKVTAIDQKNAVRAWNQAVSSTDVVSDLNKTFIAERVAPEGDKFKKMSNSTREMLEDYIVENKKASFDVNNIPKYDENGVKREGKKVFNEIEKTVSKKKGYDDAVEALESAKAMEKAVSEGTDPFTVNSEEIADISIESGIGFLSRNPIAENLKEAAKKFGIEDDSVLRYYTLSGMVTVNDEGQTVLSKKFKDAFKERVTKRLDTNIRAEGNLTTGEREMLKNEALKRMEDYVVGEWRSQQRLLVDAGASELIDTNKMFDSINGELSNIADGIKNNRNIVQILDESGNYKYVEVDPLVADLYRSRPYVQHGDDTFIRKVSRAARLSNTTFNLGSVMNQNFKDTFSSVIMAGWSHRIGTYSKELSDMFGDDFVKYLQESMGEAGWAKFSEGLTDAEAKMEATKLLTTGSMGAGSFAGNLTETKLFQEGNRGKDFASQVREMTNTAYEAMGYTKAKGMSGRKKAKRGLLTALEDYAPGNIINNKRELYYRKANYTAAFNDALKRGETVAQARATAEFVSRNATTNFQNTFMWGNYICDNVPFLSAAINGSASFWRLFEMDPVGVMTRLNAVGLYTMAQIINSGQTYEDRQTLKNIPDYIKRDNMVFVYDGTPIKVPLPEELSTFLVPFRQAAEKMLGSENRSWIELLYNDALNISPISLDGFSTEDQTALTKNEGLMSRLSREMQVIVSQCTPPAVQTAIMLATGKDPYTGKEIDTDDVYYDEDGNAQVMTYAQSEFAKFVSKMSKEHGWNLGASGAEKLLQKFFGTGTMQFFDGVTKLGEMFYGEDLDGNKVDVKEALFTAPKEAFGKVADTVTIKDYLIKDKYDTDFKKMITELTKQKNKLLAADGEYAEIVNQLGRLDSTADNFETKKKNLTQQGLQKIEDFRNTALDTVTKYVGHYGSDYDDKKFASVVALLNFDTPTVMPTTALDFERAHEQYYRGRQDAYQTMLNMGFPDTNDFSILGFAKRNAQTGEIYTKYNSPVAILNASSAVWSNMADSVNAEIASAIEVAGIDRKDMFDGYYKAKAQGSAAAKQYKKDWNAKVVKAIAPTVYQYGAETVLENSTVQDYLDNYIFISNPFKTGDYLKEIFEVEN